MTRLGWRAFDWRRQLAMALEVPENLRIRLSPRGKSATWKLDATSRFLERENPGRFPYRRSSILADLPPQRFASCESQANLSRPFFFRSKHQYVRLNHFLSWSLRCDFYRCSAGGAKSEAYKFNDCGLLSQSEAGVPLSWISGGECALAQTCGVRHLLSKNEPTLVMGEVTNDNNKRG